MTIEITYVRRCGYFDVPERGTTTIFCLFAENAIDCFWDMFPAAQGYEIINTRQIG